MRARILRTLGIRGFRAPKLRVVADLRSGRAVVLFGEKEQSASTQQVLTTCQLYRLYITDEALDDAAESYGNVEKPGLLTPAKHERG